MCTRIHGVTIAIILTFGIISVSYGYNITDKFSIGGILAGAYQYQSISDVPDFENAGRGSIPFQPEFSFKPTEKDEFFAKLGFTVGNGLTNGTTPFLQDPWAADTEESVKNINGRDRDYLLTAWYKHTFEFSVGHTLGLTGGIIDATDYIEQNDYANDEYTQFMNGALVNGPNGFAPSYDIGGAVEWDMGKWNINAVGMEVGENDEGYTYHYYGLQLAYSLETSLGEGNYRAIYQTTSDSFLDVDPTVTTLHPLTALFLSFDQQFGNIIGGWIRFGFRPDDETLIYYKSLYSGGIDISGAWWGRGQDNIGLGYAYLNGGNAGIARTQVAEGYVRFGINEFLALTFDLQYMEDKYEVGTGDDVDGIIAGVRLAAEF